MTETAHIAKPYARAVFELAQAQGDLSGWGEQLDLLAAIAADARVAALAANPRVPRARVEAFILQVADSLSAHGVNLVKLLARNGRIGALPQIAAAYAALRAQAERVVAATMTTAAELDARQRQQFTAALEKNLGRAVQLEFEVAPELLGGAVVRAGDWVIDGSVRAQLEQLAGAVRA